jgi:ketosteroid isomerase-like protein
MLPVQAAQCTMHSSKSAGVLAAWHGVVKTRDLAALSALLHDDAVFHSPVVHTPQRGKALVLRYLAGAMQVLGNDSFRYLREVVGARDAVLEFALTLDGIEVNGVDLITWDDSGRITDFKVMLRPLKAVNVVHQRMGELLAGSTKQ